jgi:L-alanine-DL-glutamate epimerase-like enolase superfamily enzyme
MLGTDLTVRDLRYRARRFAYRTPMKFGGRVVTDAVVFDVALEVELLSGRRATGYGSMTMGTVWAWPSNLLDSEKTLQTTLELAHRITRSVQNLSGHPLEICHQLASARQKLADELVTELNLPEPIPALAILLASSAVEAALFDAHGRANQTSSYRLLNAEYLRPDLGDLVDRSLAGLRLETAVRCEPQPSMPLYHLVGALDPLCPQEVIAKVNDGLPETLGDWILRDGLTHLKIKLAGDNLSWDASRITGVHQVANEAAPLRDWHYSLDFNERCQNADYVLELLDQLASKAPGLLERVQYIEQPTHRDLKRYPENRMHRVAAKIPVVIDESLVDFESLATAKEQGYSGVALKACKGHGEAMLMAAVARHWGLFLCVQDLTCIGASLLHSASLASHIPGIAAIESNGRQYCPSGNLIWDAAYPDMFTIRDGQVPTRLLNGWGLGFEWPEPCRNF